MAWAIIVHGGAYTISEHKYEANKTGCTRAAEAGAKILRDGGNCLDAVETTVRILEDDPTFNSGFGSALNSLGEVEMDAAVMEGKGLHAGGVASIRGVRHPISIARQVMGTPHALLSGEGARRFAKERGAELCEPGEMVHDEVRRAWEHGKTRTADTVGCVALDSHGNFAAGTSTGGTMHKLPGRIGDSPLIGHGLYADNMAGAVSMTGDGEAIMRLVLAHRIINSMCNGEDADRAAEEAIASMARRVGGEAGCIVLDRQGRIGLAHNTANLAFAYLTSEMSRTFAGVTKQR
jgi:beta-aspartyl-peptidase (threonine type)